MIHRLFGSVSEYFVLTKPSDTGLLVVDLDVLEAFLFVVDAVLFPACHQTSPAMMRAMIITANTTFLRTNPV